MLGKDNWLQWLFVIICLLASAYFMIGGIANIIINEEFEYAESLPADSTADNHNALFRNIQEQHASEESDNLLTWYPVYESAGSTLSYIFTLIAFGVGGAIIRILLNTLYNKKNTANINKYARVALGGLFGLLVIVLNEILPNFELESGSRKFYYSIAFLGGIYTKEFFVWLERKVLSSLAEEEK